MCLSSRLRSRGTAATCQHRREKGLRDYANVNLDVRLGRDRSEDPPLPGDGQVRPADQRAGDQGNQRQGRGVQQPVAYAGFENGWIFGWLGAGLVSMKERFCGVEHSHDNLLVREVSDSGGTLPEMYSLVCLSV